MALGSAPARYRRRREGTSSGEGEETLMSPQNARIGCVESIGKHEKAGYDAPAMSEPNTPHDPSSTPLWSPAEPGTGAPGLPSDATQPWDPSAAPTSPAPGPWSEPAPWMAPTSASVPNTGAFGAPQPWDPDPTTTAPFLAAGAVAPPPGTEGMARGVAGGRPRLPDEPPKGKKTAPAAIVGYRHRSGHHGRPGCLDPPVPARGHHGSRWPIAFVHRHGDTSTGGDGGTNRHAGRRLDAGSDALQGTDLHGQVDGGSRVPGRGWGPGA